VTGTSLRPRAALPVLSWASGLVLLAVLLAALMLPGMPPTTLWRRVLQDAAHGPVFAGIAIVLLLRRSPLPGTEFRSAAQYRDTFLVALALGVLTELVQAWMPHRQASPLDVLRDAAGAALGLCLLWWWERRRRSRNDATRACPAAAAMVWLAAVSAFALLAWHPLQAARAYAARHAAWPTLLPLGKLAEPRFALAHQAELTHASLPAGFQRPGDAQSVRLRFVTGSWPALQVFEPAPDWREHDILALDLTNPGDDPVPIVIRVHDARHDRSHEDRFNQPFEIPAGSRVTLRFSLAAIAAAPRGRRMDMAAVADLMLFAGRPLAAGDLYVTRIWLE
jgi:hypothetical protein